MVSYLFYSPITSAFALDEVNQASSPNFPILYLVRKSFGNPQTTEIKWGLGLMDLWKAAGSVENCWNLLISIREIVRTVNIEDCILIHLFIFNQSQHTPNSSFFSEGWFLFCSILIFCLLFPFSQHIFFMMRISIFSNDKSLLHCFFHFIDSLHHFI